MGNNNLQELIDTIFGLYYVTFPMAGRLPVSITFTDDLNKSHAELRPDLIEHLKRDNPQSEFNGRMVIPERVGDQIHILLNNAKVTEYTQDGSMTWVETIAHESVFRLKSAASSVFRYTPFRKKKHLFPEQSALCL